MLGAIAYYAGLCLVLYKIAQAVEFVYVYFLRGAKDLKKLGDWSIVTGATSGIGKGIALELARKKQNVVLVSRNESKLKAVAQEVEALGAQAKIVVVDFSNFDDAAKKRVVDTCSSLNVGVLVNNAGLSYPYPQWFEDTDMSVVENIIKVNCQALMTMTKLILPQMVAKKKGTVVNISSVGGVIPHQLMVVYGASKAFVNSFTDNMQAECVNKGVTFSSHMPMYVVSAMSKIKRPSLTVPTPEQYAKTAVKHFGYSGTLSPYWSHAFYAGAMQQLPWKILAPLVMNVHRTIRKKALKKYNKSK